MSKDTGLLAQQNGGAIANLINSMIVWVGALFFFLFPLAYLSSTTEFTEFTKLNLTLVVGTILLFLWGLKTVLARKVSVLRTPLNSGLVLLVGALVLSTIFSTSPFISLYGQFNVWHSTLPEIVAFVIIFFGLASVNNVRSAIRKYLIGFILSTLLLSGVLLFGYLNVFDALIGDGTGLNMISVLAIDGFSPAGNVVSTWFVLGTGIVLLIALFKLAMRKDGTIAAVVPIVGSVTVVKALIGVLLLIHILAIAVTAGAAIPRMSDKFTLPNQLSQSNSWTIASSAIRDNVWFGTGPSTYNTAYNAYKPSVINQSDQWATSYHRAGNEFFTWMTTTGVIGFAAFVFLVGKMLVLASKTLKQNSTEKQTSLPYEGTGLLYLRFPIAVIVIAILVAFVFTSSTVAIMGILFMIMILWMLVERHDEKSGVVEVTDMKFGEIADNLNVHSSGQTGTIPALPMITGLLFIVIAGLAGWYVVQDVKSNSAYADSVRFIAANSTALDIYNAQRRAISFNPRRDAYRRAYANTNISTARAVAAEKGESITDTQRQEVIQLIQQSLREVRIATEILNPYSAVNWQTRGRIYQTLLGVANGADRWALQAYQQAVVLAPQDPQLRVDLGGLYLALATTTIPAGTQGEAPSEDVPSVPETKQANLLRAISVFQDAVRLKNDFASAHFNLAVAYKEAGRNDLSLQEFETTQSLLTEGSADYTRTSEEIKKLKDAGVTPIVTPTPTQVVTPVPTAVIPTTQPTNTQIPTATPTQ